MSTTQIVFVIYNLLFLKIVYFLFVIWTNSQFFACYNYVDKYAVITCFCYILIILLEIIRNLMFSLEQNGENLMISLEIDLE